MFESEKKQVSCFCSIGEAIKKRRKEIGCSQTELAILGGLTQNAISLIENGNRFPSYTQAERIAAALKLPEGRFLRLLPPELPKTKLGELISSRLKSLGMSKRLFATRMGINFYRVTVFLRKEKVELKKAKKLANVLDVEFSEIREFIIDMSKKPAGSDLGKLIREKRKRKGLTTRELAGLLEVTYQYLNGVETGKYSLSGKKSDHLALKIATNLEISISRLNPLRLKRKKGERK